MIQGLKIAFFQPPIQPYVPSQYRLTPSEKEFGDKHISQLLVKGVLKQVEHTNGEWISNVFFRPKPNGSFRMIMDLTNLNKLVCYDHFKMFNLQTAIDLIQEGSYMARVDISDAYYTLPMSNFD